MLRGFDEMTAANAKAVAEGGPGTIEGITAMGISYLNFAVSQPALFRLMFGHKSEVRKAKQVDESGNECLKNVVQEVAAYCRKHGHNADAEQVAIGHGRSCTALRRFNSMVTRERVAPGVDVKQLIADVTPRLLGVAPEKLAPARAKKR